MLQSPDGSVTAFADTVDRSKKRAQVTQAPTFKELTQRAAEMDSESQRLEYLISSQYEEVIADLGPREEEFYEYKKKGDSYEIIRDNKTGKPLLKTKEYQKALARFNQTGDQLREDLREIAKQKVEE
ncbi:MAG: hypothetical protein AAB425_13440, partial [Bdellovibrionota bacterium]